MTENPPSAARTIRVAIERDHRGMWCATSPDLRGLRLLGDTRTGVMAAVPGALRDLMIAAHQPSGEPPVWQVEFVEDFI